MPARNLRIEPDTNERPKVWQDDAACAQPENIELRESFFSPDLHEKYQAKNLCFSCPVRKECVKDALESKTIWGIWGGRDENELRRTLSVNADGNEVRRGRYPQCPFCGARTSRLRTKTVDVPGGGRWTTSKAVECTVCGFEWKSRSSANAVNAYFTDRDNRREKREAAKAKKKP